MIHRRVPSNSHYVKKSTTNLSLLLSARKMNFLAWKSHLPKQKKSPSFLFKQLLQDPNDRFLKLRPGEQILLKEMCPNPPQKQ